MFLSLRLYIFFMLLFQQYWYIWVPIYVFEDNDKNEIFWSEVNFPYTSPEVIIMLATMQHSKRKGVGSPTIWILILNPWKCDIGQFIFLKLHLLICKMRIIIYFYTFLWELINPMPILIGLELVLDKRPLTSSEMVLSRGHLPCQAQISIATKCSSVPPFVFLDPFLVFVFSFF